MNTPKIRFKGFKDDWEQRKLGEVASDMVAGGDIDKDLILTEGQYPVIANALTGDGIVGYYDKEYRVSAPAVTVTGRGDVGHAKARLVNFTPVVRLLSVKSAHDVFFLENAINTLKIVIESTGVPQLTVPQLAKYEVVFPPQLDEEEQIGNFFQQLDHLITLHQRKCDETKQLKKFMLQKMFPKNGEKNPEIRFEGFTDDWEQRKLGDVFEQTTNFVDPNEKEIELWSLTVEDGLTPKSERYNREFLVKKDTGFKEVRPGDIVYNPMNMTLGAVGYNGMSKSVAVSGYYTTMITNEGYDSYYINTWLKSPQAMALYKTFATGSLIEKQRVQFPTLSIIPATFPQYEEQVRIGYYFMRLDHLITLHQRKCEKLKELKKFMLQNMFV